LSANKLTAAEFHILLALADEDRHGLGIVDEVERRTDGEVLLGPGILYGSLKRMVQEGLVEEATERPDPEHDDPRRRYYHVTERGSEALRAEASKWARVVEVALEKDILDKRAAT
jgi:DNA-binding PadR family transcriptional regulator